MIYSKNFHRIWNKFVNVQLWRIRWFHVKFVKFHDFWDFVIKTVHVYNIIFPYTKQGNKLNHTFVSHNFMLSNITRNAFSQWRESYSNSFARFENLNRAVKMFLCKINFQGVETYFCYTMKLFFYTIKKFYKMKKFFYMMIFCTKLKIFF